MAEARPVLLADGTATTLNSDVDWDAFDSLEYRDHNYQDVRDDDREIVRLIRDFFAGAGVSNGRGVDVGPGANLYPSLAMLPFCRTLDLCEYSASNVAWLETQKRGFDANWDEFWAIYRQDPAYAAVRDPRARFREIVTVEQSSVFTLPTRAWDLGTMFFVACSLSTDIAEFVDATHRFVDALVAGAPFAAAFMARSRGYEVGDLWFPAVAVEVGDVTQALATVAYDVKVVEIESPSPLRSDVKHGPDGQVVSIPVGMIVATGRANG
jgi:hypothetical protein